MIRIVAFLAFLCLLSKAGDITVMWDETVTTVPAARKAKVEAARSLVDWLIVSNGMPEGRDVIRVQFAPVHLGAGPLAQTYTSRYTWNAQGQLILDLEYVIRIELNLDQGFLTWPDLYLQGVVFHEMMHCAGFDGSAWFYNGHTGGTLFESDNLYAGPALAVYQQEYDPLATFIPMDDGHFAEAMDPAEIMTPGLSNSGIMDVYVSQTMLAVVADNGWTVNPDFQGGTLFELMPKRRLRDEDPLEFEP